MSPGMVSNDDTNLCNRSVVGEELFGSDFAIMCISHIACLFLCVCEIKRGYSLLLSVLKQFHKMKCGITAGLAAVIVLYCTATCLCFRL